MAWNRDLENLMAYFHVATLHNMRRDMLQLIKDEPDIGTVEHYKHVLEHIDYMIGEKS